MTPEGIEEGFVHTKRPPLPTERLIYRPALQAKASLHYSSSPAGVDRWETVALLAPLHEDLPGDIWEESTELGGEGLEVAGEQVLNAVFEDLPRAATKSSSYVTWRKKLETHLYQSRPLVLFQSKRFKAVSRPDENESEFRGRLRDLAHEERDLEIEKLRSKYGPKLNRLQERIHAADERVQREQAQYGQQKVQTAISIGTTLLGAMFGRKLTSATSMGRVATSMRGAGRAARERGDIARAQEELERFVKDLEDLEAEFTDQLEGIRTEYEGLDLEPEELKVPPRKSDISTESLLLVWLPWIVDANGIALPFYEVGEERFSDDSPS